MGCRVVIALALLVAAGCGHPAPPPVPAPPPTWSLVLDGGVINDPGLGVVPSVYVLATVAGNTVSSPSVSATPDAMAGYFDAAWDTPLLSADEPTLQTGIDLQVWSDFGNGPQMTGEALYQPPGKDFGAGVIDLGAFADVADLTVELTLD